jgi:hypothetical protein
MMSDLSGRDRQIVTILVKRWEARGREAFDIAPGEDMVADAGWPAEVPRPRRDEIRSLVAAKYFDVDKSVAPTWRFWPSATAREVFAGAEAQDRAAALNDPDERLGVILDAIVEAFEKEPDTALLTIRYDQGVIIRHPAWPIEPDIVRPHDLDQLTHLGLLGWTGTTEFWPTPRGRMASKNPEALLTELAEETADEGRRSRLRSWAEKMRAGDVAVGTATSLTGTVIRILLGA